MGSVVGLPAIDACLAHFSVMVKGTGRLSLGSAGEAGAQAYQSGVIDNLAENEADAFAQIRRFLSYLPDNVYQMPPRVEPADDPNRRDEELLSVIPRNKRKLYNPHKILNHVLDRDSLFEIAPLSGQSIITALGRVDGYPVGAIIKNPMSPSAGAMDVVAAEKLVRFLQVCDIFHLPMVCFVDEPGFMGFAVDAEAEKQGIARTAAAVVQAIRQTRMPWVTFVVRQAHGFAGSLNFRPAGMSRRFAWPSASWGSTRVEGDIGPAHNPMANTFGIEDVIDPRDTRPILCGFIEAAQGILKTQLGPGTGPSY